MRRTAPPPTRTEVRDAFGVDIGELRPRAGGFEADAFTDGRWFVKRWHDTPDDRALALTHELATRGFPVPAAVRGVDGQHTADHDGKRYAVFPFVRGRDATWDQHADIAAVMRDLHAIGDLDLPRVESNLGYGSKLVELVDHPWLAEYRGEVEAHVDRLEDALERANAIDVSHVVCHYDMQPHNVLVDDDGRLVAVVDWCWGELAPREHDLFICFDGPDPAAFVREYGAERVDLTHLEYALLARGVRDLAARVYNEVDRDGIEPWGFARMRRLDADLQLASSFS